MGMAKVNKGADKKVVSWKACCLLAEENIPVYEEVLSVLNAVTDVSPNEEIGNWIFTAFLEENIAVEKIKEVFSHAAKAAGAIDVDVKIQPVYDDEYQQALQQEFEGFHVGKFFIHNGLDWVSEGMVEVVIPAEMAFGTGEHPTTEACLILYGQQADKRKFSNGLDMGCGSAILSIAAAKLQNTPFLAVDNHAPSVEISAHNVAVNHVENLVNVTLANGFNCAHIKQAAYDIIFANILAEPLIEMSDSLAQALQPNGIAIISGFLESQKEGVYNAYRKNGCEVVDALTIENKVGRWVAAVVRKK